MKLGEIPSEWGSLWLYDLDSNGKLTRYVNWALIKLGMSLVAMLKGCSDALHITVFDNTPFELMDQIRGLLKSGYLVATSMYGKIMGLVMLWAYGQHYIMLTVILINFFTNFLLIQQK